MNRLIFFIFSVLAGISMYAQKIERVSATYIFYAPETMSVEEAKRTALERAKIQAIADKFGTTITQSTSTVISNTNGETNTKFLSLGGSDVKGEWIETIGEPQYEIQFENHLLVITCIVQGKAREIIHTKVDFIAKPLRNGTSLKYEATEFRNGDDMYLYFKTPVDGYISVYLIDNNAENVYCILPYPNTKGFSYEVKKDKEYIFFSKSNEELLQRSKVIEYVLTCDDVKEFNTLILVFSPLEISKSKLNQYVERQRPPSADYESFTKWLNSEKRKDKNLQTKEIQITIAK